MPATGISPGRASVLSVTAPRVRVSVDLVILTVRGGELAALLWRRDSEPHPGTGPCPAGSSGLMRTCQAAAARVLAERAGLPGAPVHLEQLQTYGYPDRDPRQRAVSVAYLGLAAELPAPAQPQMSWQPVSVLTEMAFDHARILQDGVERAGSKLEYTPLGRGVLPGRVHGRRAAPRLRDRLGYPARPAELSPQGDRGAPVPGADRLGHRLRRRPSGAAVPARRCRAPAPAHAQAGADRDQFLSAATLGVRPPPRAGSLPRGGRPAQEDKGVHAIAAIPAGTRPVRPVPAG